VIVDTSALLAFFDTDEPDHAAVAAVLDTATEPLVVSPYVVAELDYLVASRLGVSAELAVLRELAGGAWDLAVFGTEDLAQARAVIEHYADQSIGLADASIVILAARYQTRTVVTLDRRHFGVLRPIDGGSFKILP
jgi:predicted nucleic acid-binding protein